MTELETYSSEYSSKAIRGYETAGLQTLRCLWRDMVKKIVSDAFKEGYILAAKQAKGEVAPAPEYFWDLDLEHKYASGAPVL